MGGGEGKVGEEERPEEREGVDEGERQRGKVGREGGRRRGVKGGGGGEGGSRGGGGGRVRER